MLFPGSGEKALWLINQSHGYLEDYAHLAPFHGIINMASTVNGSVPRQSRKRKKGDHIPQMAGVGHQQRGLFELLHGLYEIMPEAPRNILISQQKASAGSLSLFQLWLLAVARVTEH